MEHRLVGAGTVSCRKYKPGPRTGRWNAVRGVVAPGTLLGPEGLGRYSLRLPSGPGPRVGGGWSGLRPGRTVPRVLRGAGGRWGGVPPVC